MQERANELELTAEQLQQHPELALLIAIFSSLILAIFVGSAILWFITFGRLQRGESLLRVEPWTPRVWGLLDLILAAGLVIVGQSISIKLWAMASGVELNELREEADFPLAAMAVASVSYLIAMLLITIWLVLRYGVSFAHVGLAGRRFVSNLIVGVAAALLSLPIVYVVMAAISASFSEQYDHPLLDRMAEEGSGFAFALAFFCAVIVAPITEEFFFRVLLQGWLQSIPWRTSGLQWFTGAREPARRFEASAGDPGAIPLATLVKEDGSALAPAADAKNPYATSGEPHVTGHALDRAFSAGPDYSRGQDYVAGPELPLAAGQKNDLISSAIGDGGVRPPLWPVFISGALFGLAHWGYGLSFIPLILLGVVLGLLYRATHSIWPSFVVHFTLNLISMLGLGLSMLIKAIA